MGKCIENSDGSIDYRNNKSILNALLKLFKIPPLPSQEIPTQLILAGNEPGLSPDLIASRIIKRQAEAGLPVGPLPSGLTSPGEIMERIRVEEIVKALQTEAKIKVAIQPGTQLQATGGNAGGPIQVLGTVLGIGSGKAKIS